jgi:hypothetical protein
MWPVPEVLLGVLAILIVVGFLSGPSTPSDTHSEKKFGAAQAAGVNAIDQQQGLDKAAGNTSGQIMSAPRASRDVSVQSKNS